MILAKKKMFWFESPVFVCLDSRITKRLYKNLDRGDMKDLLKILE